MTVRIRKVRDDVPANDDPWSVRCSRDISNGGTTERRFPTHSEALSEANRHAASCQHGRFGFSRAAS